MQKRLQFIDLHRAIVILVMIEVHIFNALIIPQIKTLPWYGVLSFINGLVAPSFLFITGFVFVLTSEKKIGEFRKFSGLFWKQLFRILMIWVIGYSLRWSGDSVWVMIKYYPPEAWAEVFKVDVLHTIAVGLLGLFALRLVLMPRQVFTWINIGLVLFFCISAPYIFMYNFHQVLPWGVANYFTPKGGSLFPLFPWLSFIFAGGAVGSLFLNWQEQQKSIMTFFYYLGGLGLFLIVSGHLVFTGSSPFLIKTPHPSPFFTSARIGYVLVLFFFCWFVSEKKDLSKSSLMDISKASLFVYWLHIMMIYAPLWNGQSLVKRIGGTLTSLECLLATGILIFLMQDVSIILVRLKNTYPKTMLYLSRAVILIPLAYFLLMIF